MAVASLVVRIAADIADFEKNIAGVERTLQRTGRNLESIGSRMTKGITLPLLAVGAVLGKIGTDFDVATDSIRAATGATGKDLEALSDSFKHVLATVPSSIADTATAIGDLSVRTGATGAQLEGLATQVLNLARVSGSDLGGVIAATTRAFGDWSISTERQAGALDFLWKTSQQTGIGVTRLTELVVQFGAPLRALGFEFEESAALMGKWEKEGVNLETVLSGLRFALSKFAKAGKEPEEALKQVQEAIKNAGTESEATAIAFQTFGKRAAIDMSRAIIEGRFNIDELVTSLKNSKETINKTAEDTKSLGEKFKELKNNVMLAVEPLATSLVQALERVVDMSKPLLSGLSDLAGWLKALPAPISDTALAFLGLLAAAGPIVFVVGKVQQAFAGVLGVVRFFIPAMATTGTSVTGLGVSFTGLLGTLGRFAGPIALVVSGLFAVKQAMDAFERSTTEGLKVVGSAILPIGLLTKAIDGLKSAFPGLGGAMDDVASIIKNSLIIAFERLKDSAGIVKDSLSRTADTIKNSFRPLFESLGVDMDRLATVMRDKVIPAVAAVAVAFITAIPGVRGLLELIAILPGFDKVAAALDRVAASTGKTADELRGFKPTFASLEGAFKDGKFSMDAWRGSLLKTDDGLAVVGQGMMTFGSGVNTHVVKPLKLGGEEIDKAGKKLKELADSFSGAGLIKAMQDTVTAVRASGVAIVDMATEQQQKITETIGAGIDQLRRLGKEAPTAATAMKNAADAALSAWRNVPTIIGFSVNQMERFIETAKSMLQPLDKVQIPEVNLGIRAFMDDMEAQIRARRPIALGELDLAETEAGIRRFMDDMDQQIRVRSTTWGQTMGKGLKGALLGAIPGIINIVGDALLGQAAGKWASVGSGIGALIGGAIGLAITGGNPIGGAAGSVAGGAAGGWLGGLFDPSDYEKAARANAAEFKRIMTTLGFELQTISNSKLLGGPGGPPTIILDVGLQTKFDKTGILAEFHAVGIELEHALLSGSAEFLQNVLDEGRAKIAEFRTEMERLNEVGGLASTALLRFVDDTRLTAQSLAFIKGEAIAAAGGIKTFLDNATISTAQGAAAMGEIVGASFAELRAQGMTSAQALRELEPTIAALQIQLQKTGLDGGAAFAHIAALASIAADEVAGPLLTAASGLTRTLEGANNAGFLTQSMFQGIAGEIINVRQRLIDQGHSSEHVNALMQNDLQTIWQLQKDHGFVVDEVTGKILEEAEAAGTIGDKYRSAFDRAALAMERVALALEAIILQAGPQGLGKVLDDATKPREVNIRAKFYVDDLDLPGGSIGARPLASGGIVRRPTFALLGEKGPEAVIPLSGTSNITPIGGGGGTVIWEVDGRVLAKAVVPHFPGEVRLHVRP